MIVDNGTIKFESRREVSKALEALSVYKKEHPSEGDNDLLEELISGLDIMEMCW